MTKLFIVVSPRVTTRDHWNFNGPYYLARRGECTVADQFLKTIEWRASEGGYCILDPWNKRHYIKVEFSPHALCWGEVQYLTRDNKFEEGVAEWEIFRPCPEELGCDIPIIELTAEELHLITEGSEASEASTSRSHTCAPSESGEESRQEPEPICVLPAVAPTPGTDERQLAALAESLHITPMSQTVTQQHIEIVEAPCFGVIDPTTGHMMDTDDAALHRAIGSDQGDPPSGGGGPPYGGAPSGGGSPFGGNPGGGGGGGPPHGHPLLGGGQASQANNSKLIRNPPAVFAGEHDKAEHFLT